MQVSLLRKQGLKEGEAGKALRPSPKLWSGKMAFASCWKEVLPVLQRAQITLTLSLLRMRFEKSIYHLTFKTK